uniref:Photolyase/cryptochrome alpha/beta domain-containing protein n=1 Tax=Compsopogon caeruleus TaxID=31354 RepID=A0A7S1XE95_9RHOD|mmetsp:Transcript_17606/g.36544  ORF Transcript_17606/g.36544 Transcript_17606/m.36544 type:complete len:342 (+) Transcript_17606:109-1134(+)
MLGFLVGVGGGLLEIGVARDRRVVVRKSCIKSLALVPWASSVGEASLTRSRVTAAPRPHEVQDREAITFSAQPPFAGAGPKRVLVWFHEDLRVDDNEALASAAKRASVLGGALLPAFVVEDKCSDLVKQAASTLKAELQGLGSDLVSRSGSVADALVELFNTSKMDAIYYNHAVTGEGIQLERKVLGKLRELGIEAEGFWSNTLFRPDAFEKVRPTEVFKAVFDGSVAAPQERPTSLPRLPEGIDAGLSVVTNRTNQASIARKLMGEFNKSSEALHLSPSGDFAFRVKPYLDAGILSPKILFHHIVREVGGPRGYTVHELGWRSYSCLALHSCSTPTKVAV